MRRPPPNRQRRNGAGALLPVPLPSQLRDGPAAAGDRNRRGPAPEQSATGSRATRIKPDSLRYLLILLIVVAVSRVHQHFPVLASLRIVLIITLAAGAFAWANPRLLRLESPLVTWPARVMAALGIMACLSIPFGLSIGASGKFMIEGYSKTLILAFLVLAGTRNVRDLRTLVMGFVIGAAILAFLSLFVFPVEETGANGLLRLAWGYTFDGNDLATMADAGIAVSLCLLMAGRGATRAFALVTICGLAATVGRSGSRGGFIGLVALGLAALFLFHNVPVWKRLGIVFVAAAGLFLASPVGYWKQMETITSPKEDYNWSAPYGRRNVWKRGMNYMFTHPATGVGVGNFPRAEGTISPLARQYQLSPSPRGHIAWIAPHNSFLEAGAEMGIPGLLLFSTLVLGGIIGMHRLGRTMPQQWTRGDDDQRFLSYLPACLAAAMASFAVAGFFVSFAYQDLPYLLGSFMSAAYLCVGDALGKRLPSSTRRLEGRESTARRL